MDEFPVREYFKHNVVFGEGELGDSAYILKKGKVEISKKMGGRRMVIAELDAVSIFGEMALISEDHRRTATARALEPIEVIAIDKKKFDELVFETPSIIGVVLGELAKRLADETEKRCLER
jgi:CRP-like cAMP-binding protein